MIFLSSVLFTVALLLPLPACIRDAWIKEEPLYQAVGFAGMANIFVGLLVTWVGFVRRCRWAWFVMFIIVWVGGFPILVLPLLQHKIALTFTEWIYSALGTSGDARIWAESVLIFALLAISLLLPIKSFFWNRQGSSGSTLWWAD